MWGKNLRSPSNSRYRAPKRGPGKFRQILKKKIPPWWAVTFGLWRLTVLSSTTEEEGYNLFVYLVFSDFVLKCVIKCCQIIRLWLYYTLLDFCHCSFRWYTSEVNNFELSMLTYAEIMKKKTAKNKGYKKKVGEKHESCRRTFIFTVGKKLL